jgi:hypothetical protein
LPNFLCIECHACTAPGIVTESGLNNPISVIFFSSKYSNVAFFGAIPEPLTATGFLPLREINAKQSPPTPVEPGSITDCTADTA